MSDDNLSKEERKALKVWKCGVRRSSKNEHLVQHSRLISPLANLPPNLSVRRKSAS